MTWPQDDRHYAFAALSPVPADTLNEMQDRIVDLHRERKLIVDAYSTELDGSNLPAWVTATANPWFICRAAGFGLCARARFPHGAIIKEIHAKVYLASASGMTIDIYQDDTNMAVAATTPTSISLGNQLTPAPGGYPTWDVASWTDGVNGFSETTIPNDSMIRVLFDNNPSTSDLVGGVQIVYEPITPTP